MKHVTPQIDGQPLECPEDLADALTPKTARRAPQPRKSLSDAERLAKGRRKLDRLRKEAATQIDRLIELLDATDDDAELEPCLGAPEIPAAFNEYSEKWRMWLTCQGWASGSIDNRGEEPEHGEETNDAEPSLGSINPNMSGTQAMWLAGGASDLEDEHDGREDGADASPTTAASPIRTVTWNSALRCSSIAM